MWGWPVGRGPTGGMQGTYLAFFIDVKRSTCLDTEVMTSTILRRVPCLDSGTSDLATVTCVPRNALVAWAELIARRQAALTCASVCCSHGTAWIWCRQRRARPRLFLPARLLCRRRLAWCLLVEPSRLRATPPLFGRFRRSSNVCGLRVLGRSRFLSRAGVCAAGTARRRRRREGRYRTRRAVRRGSAPLSRAKRGESAAKGARLAVRALRMQRTQLALPWRGLRARNTTLSANR